MWIIPISDSNFPAVFLTLRRNRIAIIVNKKVWRHFRTFQGKPLYITIIQVYAMTSNAEEAEVERFYEDLQDLSERTLPKRCPFHYRELECKSRKSRNVSRNPINPGDCKLGVWPKTAKRNVQNDWREDSRETTLLWSGGAVGPLLRFLREAEICYCLNVTCLHFESPGQHKHNSSLH